MDFFDLILQERKEVTPKTGFNICVYDGNAPLGENLTIIEHVVTEAETKKYTGKSKYYIFGKE